MSGSVIKNHLVSKNFPECELFANFKIFYDLQADEFASQVASDSLGIHGDICYLYLKA